MVSSPCQLLADRRRVHQAALRPKFVEAPRNIERRLLAHILLIHLAIVTNLLDNFVGPVARNAETLRRGGVAAQEEFSLRRSVLQLVVDILRGDAEFFSCDHSINRPADESEPLVVTLAHNRSERLFRD